MRVSQRMMRNRYLTNYNNNLSNLDRLMRQNQTFRRFERTSEDVVNSTHALTIRDDLARSEAYKSNAEEAKGFFESAETSLMTINDISKDVYNKLIYGMNDPSGDAGREILAREIRTFADEVLKVANTDYAGRYVLGGSNNSEPPFALDKNGKLTFNGDPVDKNNPATGKPYTDLELVTAFPKNNEIYMDLGLGLKIDNNGEIDKSSAVVISNSGIRALGHGVDKDGDPRNIYSLFNKIADTLDPAKGSFDHEEAGRLLEKLKDAQSNLMLDVTKLGDKCNFMDFNVKRFNDNILGLQKGQNIAESVNPAEVIIDMKSYEYIYKSTLSMGTKLLQQSIFDFMN